MSIRAKEIYVSSKTKKRLYWVQQVVPELHDGDGRIRKLTQDEIAEALLTEIIEQKYPNIKTLEKRLDALEGQLISELLSPSEQVK